LKILCFIDSLGSGGAQRQMVELAIGFKDKGHSVEVLIYHPIFFFQNGLNKNGIKTNVIEENNFFLRVIKIRKFIRHCNPDSVLSFLQGSNLIAELSGFPFKKWNLVVGERSANPNISKKPFLIALRMMHLFADSIVSNSNKNIEIVRRVNPFLSKERCHVVYNSIDLNKWKTDSSKVAQNNGKFVIAVAASVVSHKNPLGLVKALNRLSERMKAKVRVHWFGKILNEEYHLKVTKFIRENQLEDCFEFKGESGDVQKEYQRADAVGLFSLYEGLPNAVCEGMAMSKVVIASNISDVSLLLGSNNQELLFDPNQIDEIAKSIEWLLKASKADLDKIENSNRKESLRLFNRETIVDSYLQILNG
jgi:glycosyltransferase involved in cell wall biosynthesis